MSIEDYIRAQRSNVDSIGKLPHFSVLGQAVNDLYEKAVGLVPKDSPPHFACLLLLCHKSFLSAIALIAQGQPEDAAAITRRAIEIAQVALAVKAKPGNAEKWVVFEKRMARWQARDRGEKPKNLYTELDLPSDHQILNELKKQLGILSDAHIHFTPEFYGSQNWIHSLGRIELRYFTSDQRVIERELITLTDIHASIVRIFDECFGHAFFDNSDWMETWKTLEENARLLAKPFEPIQEARD
ncbi:MAG: hypothetical protein FJ246_04140 [Nitrospira sp.]|nr:hypothetical protein [Nitrospira sp.]